jgi:hypothetical protein
MAEVAEIRQIAGIDPAGENIATMLAATINVAV